ncbi:MAG: serine/threonine protein kinase [Nitrososphaerota archaeon]|nr:serine/threonine protein kinase [Aigarchaeota archaeon]MDW8076151.1 serine/threonine protein kinase [Nitrososphaerota archaeon]
MTTKNGLLLIGKGFRSIVLVGTLGDRLVAIKVLRSDSPINSMEREARMLKIANSINVGPRILYYTKDFIIMEYIFGSNIESWIRSLSFESPEKLRWILRLCFEDCFRLDNVGLDHGELSDASKHVIISEELKPFIVDFSNASITRKVSNVTSFLSYITHGKVSRIVGQTLGIKMQNIDIVRRYKQCVSYENFDFLMRSLGL